MNDRAAVVLAVLVAVVAAVAPPVPPAAALVFVAVWAVERHPSLLAVALVVLVAGSASDSLQALAQPLPERFEGEAQLASDPERQQFATRFVIRADGRRYLAEVPDERAGQVRHLLTGEWVHIAGRPQPLSSAPQGWVRSQHLAGRLAVSEVSDLRRSPPWYRAANAVHRLLSDGAASFGDRRPLYLGLVIGDDRGQSELREFRFEASGLTHLLAVSGSNVAFVLAVAAPVMVRLGRRGRMLLGAALLFLFVLVTRAEPSVLRATVMAGVALAAVTTGRVAPARRVLAVAIVLLLAMDPLLVHSLGFQLSVAATAGLMTMSKPIMERLPGPDVLTGPLAVTIAAQLATAPLLLALNGALPASATLANLLAGPAAGLVMMLGVTAGLAAGLVGDTTAAWIQQPAVWSVRWIDEVATLSSRAPLPVMGPGRLALLATAVLAVLMARRVAARGPHIVVPTVAIVVAGGCTLGALWPLGPGPGRHVLDTGAELAVGGCGGRVLSLDGAGNQRALLRSIWRSGVRDVDVLVVGASRSDVRAARTVAEQFGVARLVTTAGRAPPGIESLAGRELRVGGVTVVQPAPSGDRTSGPSVQIERSEGRCTVTP